MSRRLGSKARSATGRPAARPAAPRDAQATGILPLNLANGHAWGKKSRWRRMNDDGATLGSKPPRIRRVSLRRGSSHRPVFVILAQKQDALDLPRNHVARQEQPRQKDIGMLQFGAWFPARSSGTPHERGVDVEPGVGEHGQE